MQVSKSRSWHFGPREEPKSSQKRQKEQFLIVSMDPEAEQLVLRELGHFLLYCTQCSVSLWLRAPSQFAFYGAVSAIMRDIEQKKMHIGKSCSGPWKISEYYWAYLLSLDFSHYGEWNVEMHYLMCSHGHHVNVMTLRHTDTCEMWQKKEKKRVKCKLPGLFASNTEGRIVYQLPVFWSHVQSDNI